MTSSVTPSTTFSDSKNHFIILDGLRGIAAITVVLFHLFETFTNTNHLVQIINHGYLAVDFFFVLSGFVIGYAYDDRWNKMSITEFFKRRLIRLHPMIIMGMLMGAVCFYFQASPELFPKLNAVPLWQMILTMLVGFTLLPLPPVFDIRGWAEMYPLNGPGWSLFLEYVANILYALIVRKMSNKALAVLVFVAGCVLIHFAITNPQGDLIGGWSLEPSQLRVAFTRLIYPFFAGLLLSRISRPGHIKNAFGWCSLMILGILAFPRIGGSENLWMNGLYDALSVIFLFPLIVYIGASGEITGKYMSKICNFLSDISYPVYIIHYPFIYIFTAWVVNHKIPMENAWPMGLLVLAASIAVSYGSLKLYDIPVRRWLSSRYLAHVNK